MRAIANLLAWAMLVAAVSNGCSRGGRTAGTTGKKAGEARRAVRGKVRVGDRAPDFALPSQTGQIVSLKDFRGKNAVVLYFYPKDETRVCTAEACAFRDSYEVFKQAGAALIGVSSDPVASHQEFAAHHNLPFILLSDRSGKLRQRYGVPTTLGLLPGRVT